MNLLDLINVYAGGPGSGCNPEVGQCGRKPGEGEVQTGVSDRVRGAIESYVPVTAAKYQLAKRNERKVAKVLGGTGTPNNSPFDVLVGDIAIEVKTVIEAK